MEDEDSDDEDRLRSTVRCHSVNSFVISPVSCLICRLLQESSLFRTCTYEFKAPSPYQSSMIKITLRDGHYILLLEHLNDVIKGIDSFESVRHISPLRRLVHALLGYQIKPFRMSILALDCCEFLKVIQSLLDGWMAIYQTSALSPCPESTQISLVSEVVRVSWSRVDHNECVVRYKHTALEVFDISVCNDDCGSDVYLFHLSSFAVSFIPFRPIRQLSFSKIKFSQRLLLVSCHASRLIICDFEFSIISCAADPSPDAGCALSLSPPSLTLVTSLTLS